MTIRDQLATLARQFPNSKELAVNAQQLEAYERELVWIQKFSSSDPIILRTWPIEDLGTIKAQRTPFYFRDRQLTKVWK